MNPKLWSYLRAWQPGQSICYLGGSGQFQMLPTAFHEVDAEDAFSIELSPPQTSTQNFPTFSRGILGFISYDDAAQGLTKIQTSRFLRVDESLVFPNVEPVLTQMQDSTPLHLISVESDDSYMGKVEEIKTQIRAGRFYQLNLLRYFQVEGDVSPQNLLARMAKFGGPYAAWIELPGLSLWSFSPEQFVELNWKEGHGYLRTFPIKGTIPRSPIPSEDEEQKKKLQQSVKDQAELNMIIDLMRNDIQQLCLPATVEVKCTGRLQSFTNVHHLVGEVEGRLRGEIRLGDLLRALCPAGSITGAPKREVIRGIHEFEGRERRFFMGHLFYYDEISGRFDSSVLIRTMVRNEQEKAYEFAAGSGIVVQSCADTERLEIQAKCRVLTAH